MLPGVDPDGTTTARQMLIYTLALIGVSVTPLFITEASPMFGFGALGLGVFFLRFVWAFALQPGDARARRVMQASLIYLPGILGLFLLERWMRFLIG
jgi:protoheme IX farnesyltransferase